MEDPEPRSRPARPGGPGLDPFRYLRRRDEESGRWSPDRLNTFCDGVFAIAVTLLALSVRVPTDVAGRAQFSAAVPRLLGDLGVYALGFFVVGQYWQAHHRGMRRVEEIDDRVVRRTVLFLAGVAAVPVAIGLLVHDGGFPEAVTIASALLALTSLASAWTFAAALRPGLATVTADVRRRVLLRGVVTAVVFALAIPVAYLLPPSRSGSAPYVWLLLLVSGLLVDGADRADRAVRAGVRDIRADLRRGGPGSGRRARR